MASAAATLTPDCYVAILKGKMSEFGATGTCVSDRLVPLLEISNPKSAASAITKACLHLGVSWIHCLNFEGDDETSFAADIEQLFDDLRLSTLAVPVITETEDPTTLTTIARIVATDARGVVLRIEAEDIINPATNTVADIDSTLTQLSLTRPECDLIIDCGLLEGTAVVQAALADNCLQQISGIGDFRNIVIAFSAFPPAVGELVSPESVQALPRIDADAFVATRKMTQHDIVFGDYTIGNPKYADAPFSPIPNIRYASANEWIVHRAKERKAPGPQYRGLAQDLIAAPYYSGPGFCYGDQQIEDVATGASGPGNAMTHLRAGISRHIHVVLERLSTLGVP